MNQRWRSRRHSYRPPDEPIATHLYEVAAIPGDRVARTFVEEHHYSRSYPAARFRYGLYRAAELVGVAVFSVPMNPGALRRDFPAGAPAVELGRFVLLDDVPGNGETWFLARAFELLRADGIAGVLSCSDPVPRTTASGRVVMPGHVGTIYQAHNGVQRGRTRARVLNLLPDGRVFSERSEQKIRGGERGRAYSVALLVEAGAPPLEPDENADAWCDTWIPRLTRPLAHPGNHRYAWALDRALRRTLTPLGPYPKKEAH